MGDILFLILRRLRTPLIAMIVIYAISTLLMASAPGIDPSGRPWRLSLFEAFYVVSYTATTIGFGELPHPFSGAQRAATVVVIYLSVIGWAYALGSVFALTNDAVFRAALLRARFARQVARLNEASLQGPAPAQGGRRPSTRCAARGWHRACGVPRGDRADRR